MVDDGEGELQAADEDGIFQGATSETPLLFRPTHREPDAFH
jgi:hypothetical protein